MTLKNYLFNFSKYYKIYFAALFVISILAASFEILVTYQIKEIIDSIAADNYHNLGRLLLFFVALKFLLHGMFFIVRLLDIKYKPGMVTKLTKDIYQKTIAHSLHWFDSHMSGEIADKINSFQVSLTHLVTNIFRSLVVIWVILIGLFFLFKISFWSALVQLGFLVIYTPIIYVLLKKQLKLQQNYETQNQKTTGIINDSIANIFGIKVVGNLKSELKQKLNPALLARQKWDRKTRVFDAFWVDNVDTVLIVIMSAIQIYLLAHLFKIGEISAGGFAFVAMLMLNIHRDIDSLLEKILFGINPQIAQIKASYEFINEEIKTPDLPSAKILKKVKGNISFKKVFFAYEDGSKQILDNFSLEIKAGEKIGLVGHSGAGKSTLIKSLVRYFDIERGNILIDDYDLRKVTQESLRANISVIPQDITMFHRTILENLKIAKSSATKAEIIAACKKAEIHNDILKMKHGYDSIVGERGIKVSGGQRQRIAIARAILKDAPILILDEATSSLDSKTEQQIQLSLDRLIADKTKTVIAIAHRLSTLKNMDRIIVMDKGKIVEEGTHQKLLRNKKSLYAKLWKLQEI